MLVKVSCAELNDDLIKQESYLRELVSLSSIGYKTFKSELSRISKSVSDAYSPSSCLKVSMYDLCSC